MTAKQGFEAGECLLEPRRAPELEAEVRKRLGIVPPSFP